MKRRKVLISMLLCLSVASMTVCVNAQEASTSEVEEQKVDTESFYATVTEAEDYGASITKIIVDYGVVFEAGTELNNDDFSASVVRKYAGTEDLVQEMSYETFSYDVSKTAEGEREIANVYLSDEAGNATDEDTSYVTLEMVYGPEEGYGNPLGAELETGLGMNVVLDCDYTLTYTDKAGNIYTCNTKKEELCTTPDIDEFTHGQVFVSTSESIVNDEYDNETLYYASYEPKDEEKHPLIIWLHGMGEGGTDTRVPLLGAEAGVFVREETQDIFGGAYVLVPQCPLVWMNTGSGEISVTAENPTSIYTVALMDLIENYVTENPNIDTNRIYIGGCSNGGYMTMNMLINYPDYFTAAYPICEAYNDEFISDEEIDQMKDTPIWFTHAVTDTLVDPAIYTVPTYERLIEAGASDVLFTFWTNVHDTTGLYHDEDGNPSEYFGHASWRYLLNNECTLDKDYSSGNTCDEKGTGETVFEWLAEQSK